MTSHLQECTDFKCLLYAPGRRRLRKHVFRLGDGEDIQTYRYEQGRELLDKELWLRVEEIDGPRILNYRVLAEP